MGNIAASAYKSAVREGLKAAMLTAAKGLVNAAIQWGYNYEVQKFFSRQVEHYMERRDINPNSSRGRTVSFLGQWGSGIVASSLNPLPADVFQPFDAEGNYQPAGSLLGGMMNGTSENIFITLGILRQGDTMTTVFSDQVSTREGFSSNITTNRPGTVQRSLSGGGEKADGISIDLMH